MILNFILCFAALLIRLCGAQHLICNVTQVLRGTLYSVPESGATGCYYSWMNSTGHVLANEKGKMDQLVFNSSIGTLISHTCWVQLNYTRDCVSEVIQHTAYCFTDCMTPKPLKIEGTLRHYRSTFISFSIMALLLHVANRLCPAHTDLENFEAFKKMTKSLQCG